MPSVLHNGRGHITMRIRFMLLFTRGGGGGGEEAEGRELECNAIVQLLLPHVTLSSCDTYVPGVSTEMHRLSVI